MTPTDSTGRAINPKTGYRYGYYDENPPDEWEDCGCCGAVHPPEFDGDCRDDLNRWHSAECVAALEAGTHPFQPRTT